MIVITIHGQSMLPTFAPGDRVLALRYWPYSWLRNNQIIILDYPTGVHRQQPSSLFIKRLTGLPGETVITHLADLPDAWQEYDTAGQRVWHIPPHHYFVRADGIGVDSLIWGPLPLASLVGVVVARLPRKTTQQLPTAVSESPLFPPAKR